MNISTEKIRKDVELRRSYQASIAMAFIDHYHSYKKRNKKKYLNDKEIHDIANEGAVQFLRWLCDDEKLKDAR